MPAYVKNGGAYQYLKGMWVKNNGAFAPVKEAWVKDAGVWKKLWPNSGSIAFGPGVHPFVVPYYNHLTIDVRGAGGGATQEDGEGQKGGASHFDSTVQVFADGGTGAWHGVVAWIPSGGWYWPVRGGRAGSPGGASGGDQNITGGAHNGVSSWGAADGSIKSGAGGQAVKTWARNSPNAPVPGSTIMITVGAGGQGANGYTNGGDGWVGVAWE